MRVSLVTLFLCLVVLGIGISSGRAAAETGQDVLDSTEQYAEVYGLTYAEASQRLELQKIAAGFHDRLRDVLGDAYAGVEFVHKPKFLVRIWVAPAADPSGIAKLAMEYPELDVEYVPVEFTARELVDRFHEALRVMVDVEITNGAALVDEARQRIVIQVPSERIALARSAVESERLNANGPPVDVVQRDTFDERNTSGGRHIPGWCMVAFSVRSIKASEYGRLGVATAGHCERSAFGNHPELGALTWVRGIYSDDIYDAGYAAASASNADYDDRIATYSGQTPSISSVGGNVAVGQTLCLTGDPYSESGDAPDYSCAWAYTNSYCSVDFDDCDGIETTFDGKYVLMLDPYERITDFGDSGGPWHAGSSYTTVAYGINSGGSPSRNSAWGNYSFGGETCPPQGCWNAAFTAAHWLDDSPVSLQVLTTSPPTCNGLELTHWGTNASETIHGTSGDDVIDAGGGNDTIYAYGGNDVICGGSGNDVIYASSGNDTLRGDSGTDTCDGSTGTDSTSNCEVVSGNEDVNWMERNANSNGSVNISFYYALPSDVKVVGDWNGDGVDTPGVFRNGQWLLRNSNSSGSEDLSFGFGNAGDIPVVGDWNGNGVDTIGVYRNGQWYLRNYNSAGAASYSFAYGGASSDVPVTGDWNNNGTDTIGVFRDGQWFLRNYNSAGAASYDFWFGDPGDIPVTGDWNNSGTDTIGLFRSGRWFLRNTNSTGGANYDFYFGASGDHAVTGDWDNNGTDTIGVARDL